MIFKDDAQAIQYLKANQALNPLFLEMREKSHELKSLVNGTNFIDELINKIEGIESAQKAVARKKYSRNIKDLFTRLFQPIGNIYYATGGIKDYDVKGNVRDTFLNKIANVRDDKTLSEWVQSNAIQLLNTDPNGLIFLEYKNDNVYPTYKSIDVIRFYKPKGQLVDYVIFEPTIINQKTYWRIVDDSTDRTFEQNGNDFILIEDLTFEHPFGQVPALICSNIQRAGEKQKLSAIDSIVEVAKEYARDLSFLSIYKVYHGAPIFWKYIQFCDDCSGTGKQQDEQCPTCDGHGQMRAKTDVTDVVTLPYPEDKDSVQVDAIAGYIVPPIETWTKYEETLKELDEQIYKTHWGTNYGSQAVQGMKTATEVQFDKQPLENQLNVYADFAEYVEWKLSEWILNFIDVTKVNKLESKITINLGRRYIIESYDVLLERYEKSVLAEENSVILDKLFSEYLGAKYRNNPIDLQLNILKSKIEPYLHLSIKNVSLIFGNEEAQRKILFSKWWNGLTNQTTATEEQFNDWFELNKKVITIKTE